MAKDLSGFSYTDEDLAAIQSARQEEKPWDSQHIKALKSRIKEFLLSITGELCCYCQKELHGESKMVIDVEHIVPKGKYDALMFHIPNLSVACKRCNMDIKRANTDFLNLPFECADVGLQEKYKFVHPNLDDRDQHLIRCAFQIGEHRIIKYRARSAKGEYTYAYFKLDALETESFDEAQGANQSNAAEASVLAEIRSLVMSIE